MNAIITLGRPSTYSQALADRLIARVANGETLKASCEAESVSLATVSQWLAKHDTFAKPYADAKQVQLDVMAEEIIPLADSALGKDSAGVQATKTMVDARKWMLSKLRASTYGDKLDVTSKGEALAAPSHQVDARVQSIVMQAAMRMQSSVLDDEAKGLLE